MKYKVMIEETLSRTVTVEASSQRQAEQMAREDYRDCKIVLSGDDYSETRFKVIPPESPYRCAPDG